MADKFIGADLLPADRLREYRAYRDTAQPHATAHRSTAELAK
ncbi:hypothetical protein [Streptomyces dysideae]|nr:hypothetical protein [Streptomyces dysideae]